MSTNQHATDKSFSLPWPLGLGGLDTALVEKIERINTALGIVDALEWHRNILVLAVLHYQGHGDLELAEELAEACRSLYTDVGVFAAVRKAEDSIERTVERLQRSQQWLTEASLDPSPAVDQGLLNAIGGWRATESILRSVRDYPDHCIWGPDAHCPEDVSVFCHSCERENGDCFVNKSIKERLFGVIGGIDANI